MPNSHAARQSPGPDVPARTRKLSAGKIGAISLAGTTIEWYDFFIYGTAAALVFPRVFFPEMTPFVATLVSFSTFAVGIVARPVGGIIFGHFGDRVGRKKVLVIAMVMMGMSTALIGALPSAATIGIAAPLLLILLRIVQGIALGGQWGGSVLIVTENAAPGRRGFFGSIPQLGNGFGILFANSAFLILTLVFPEAFLAWAWRIPFLVSVILVVVALYMNHRLEDTIDFEKATAAGTTKSPIIAVIRRYPREILLAGCAFMIVNAGYFIASTYGLSYGTEVLQVDRQTILFGIVVSALVSIPITLYAGHLSDRFGRRAVYTTAAVAHLLWVFPFFWLFDSRSGVAIWIALILSQLTLNAMYGPLAALFSELFEPRVRYSGASLAYQFGAVFGGGFAPTICAALYEAFQTSLAISAYWGVVAAISLVAIIALTVRQGTPEAAAAPADPAVAKA
jgi:MHS family shikimate/dehydroshikimate transporter-like MFS transporter